MIKLCIFCKHCEYEEPYFYSELTFNDGSIDCLKGHWSSGNIDELRAGKGFEIANQCPDFALPREIKKLLARQNGGGKS